MSIFFYQIFEAGLYWVSVVNVNGPEKKLKFDIQSYNNALNQGVE